MDQGKLCIFMDHAPGYIIKSPMTKTYPGHIRTLGLHMKYEQGDPISIFITESYTDYTKPYPNHTKQSSNYTSQYLNHN